MCISERCFTPSGLDLKAGSRVSDRRDHVQDDCNLPAASKIVELLHLGIIQLASGFSYTLPPNPLAKDKPTASYIFALPLYYVRPSTSKGNPADLQSHTNPTSSRQCCLSTDSLPLFFAPRWLLTQTPRGNPSGVL